LGGPNTPGPKGRSKGKRANPAVHPKMRNKSKQAAVLTLLSHARPMRPATSANEARLYRNPTNPDWCLDRIKRLLAARANISR
jgi:hypothetical protein